MEAVEFEATIDNGMIPIPQQYRDTLIDKMEVVVHAMENNSQKPLKQQKKKIHYIGIDMTGFRFDREEANARR
ncbi:MAG: hypothetical protein FWH35_00205 [Treponema sp.]|nr:hypothetical protein [Treponema sp.]